MMIMPQAKKQTSRKASKKQVHSRVAKTIKAKSTRTRGASLRGVKGKNVKSTTKHTRLSQKTSSYTRGKQLLSIAYNGSGSEFVFKLTTLQGKVSSEFHVKGNHIMNTMGIPIMVTPYT